MSEQFGGGEGQLRKMLTLRCTRHIASAFAEHYGVPKKIMEFGADHPHWLEAFGELGTSQFHHLGNAQQEAEAFSKFAELLTRFSLEDEPKTEDYDLTICINYPELIPPIDPDELIRKLTGRSNTVLFSAPIPFEGLERYPTEQWPSWWARKFKEWGYSPETQLRTELWDNEQIDWQLRQNLIVFKRKPATSEEGDLSRSSLEVLNIVHPANYLEKLRMVSVAGAKTATNHTPTNAVNDSLKGMILLMSRTPIIGKLLIRMRRFALLRLLWRKLG